MLESRADEEGAAGRCRRVEVLTIDTWLPVTHREDGGAYTWDAEPVAGELRDELLKHVDMVVTTADERPKRWTTWRE